MIPGVFDDIFGVRLFGYISFRMAMAALSAFAFALWWGRPTIAWLRKHRVQEDVSKTDAYDLARLNKANNKHETTTMGGSFLIAALLTSVLLWARLDNIHVVLGVLLVAGFAAVGFVDDFKKLTVEKSLGLSRSAKMLGLSIVTFGCLGALCYYSRTSGRGTLLDLYPPLLKDFVVPLSAWGFGGIAIFLSFEWFVVVGSANATNITDGLDGLAAGCLIISGLALSIFCYVSGRHDWTAYLHLPHIVAASEMAVVGGALVGACMGFLWYNAYPAQVFMGDSGSLPLGGLLGWMALVSKQELVLPLIACVFVLDLCSSWLQTFYYKRTKKRIFTCAPVHHGLQLHGGFFKKADKPWHEVQIVIRFWIVAACGAMASLALLKVR
ncbi:MAG: phospho-N-acetylmuramoyl-pentapeptide-transferase [Planctomycetota bacterium]|jgi:phospho-N-acetylmuramoyl-pentapeptide-transferase